MQLTPEQRQAVDRQRREHPEARGVRLEFTEEQRAEWRRLVDAELAGKAANVERRRKIAEAAQEPGFSGDLRRAILAGGGPDKAALAERIGVSWEEFDAFRAGEGSLSSEAVDRLVSELGLRLMPQAAND